jgi:ribosomal protein S12 methylthiotransferase
VGFPGESKKQFKKLCDFIEEDKIRFASFFTYYREEKTKAYYMPKQVPKFIKKLRLKKIEKIQNLNLNRFALSQIGKVERVLVDEFDENKKIFLSHSQKNSPNVDLCVIIEADNPNSVNVTTGDFVNVRIVDLHEKGFKGEVIL